MITGTLIEAGDIDRGEGALVTGVIIEMTKEHLKSMPSILIDSEVVVIDRVKFTLLIEAAYCEGIEDKEDNSGTNKNTLWNRSDSKRIAGGKE